MARTIHLAILVAALACAPVVAAQSGAGLAVQAGQAVSAPSAAMPALDTGRSPKVAAGLADLGEEPAELAGFIAALNAARERAGLFPVVWSDKAAVAALEAAEAAAATGCTRTAAIQAGAAHGASTYWSSGVRNYSGDARSQTIQPGFIVSEWRNRGESYNPATGRCARPGECDSFARLMVPRASVAGCARITCPSQAQVWACRFDE